MEYLNTNINTIDVMFRSDGDADFAEVYLNHVRNTAETSLVVGDVQHDHPVNRFHRDGEPE